MANGTAMQETLYGLGFDVDQASINKAKASIKGVAEESKKLSQVEKQVADEAQNVIDVLDEVGKREANIKRLVTRFKEAADAGDDVSQAAESVARALGRLGATGDEIKQVTEELKFSTKQAQALDEAFTAIARNEKFGLVSQRAALAGDVESNLRTVGGAFGAFGGTGVERAAAQAGEIFAVIEAAPRLKAAFQGMPQVIQAAYQEIGASGVGLIGALVALTAVSAIARKQFQDQAKFARATIESQRSAFDILVSGSEEEIALRRREVETKINIERQYLKTQENQYQRLLQGTSDVLGGELASIVEFTGKNLGLGGAAFKEIDTEIQASRNSISGWEKELAILNNGIEGLNNTTIKAAQAEEELAAQREALAQATFGLLDFQRQVRTLTADGDITGLRELQSQIVLEAENARADRERIGRILSAKEGADIFSREAAQAFIDSFADPIDKALAELALESPELLIAQLDSLNETIGETNAQADILRREFEYINATVDTSVNRFKGLGIEIFKAGDNSRALSDRLQDVQNQIKEQTKLSDELASITQKGADKITDIRRNLAQKEADLLSNLARSLADAQTKAKQALADLDRKQTDELLKIEEDYAKERAKIIRDANRDIGMAIEERDVLGFVQAKRARDEQLEDAKQNYDDQRRELQRAYEQQLRDIQINLIRQQQELRLQYNRQLQDARQAAQQQIQMTQQQIQAELNLRRQGYNAMLQAEQSFVQAQISMMQNLVNSASTILGGLAGAIAQAQQVANSGTASAINLLNQNGFNAPVNILGGTTGGNNTINQTNHFPSNVNSQQIVGDILGQLSALIG